jgi:hypothetical protein
MGHQKSPQKFPKDPEIDFRVRFAAPVTNEEASRAYVKASNREKTQLNSRQTVSDVPIQKLILTNAQLDGIKQLHARNETVSMEFYAGGDNVKEAQESAAALMASHGLDTESRDDPCSKWSARWSTLSSKTAGPGQTRRVLFQW